MSRAPRECVECGAEAIDHRLTYITVAIDEAMRPLLSPGPISGLLSKPVLALERALGPSIMRSFLSIGLAVEKSESDERTLLLARMTWEEAARRGIRMTELRLFGLPRNLFFATLPDGRRIVFEGMPLPERSFRQAWWIDNKEEMKRRFVKAGIPVARGGGAFTWRKAKRIFEEVGAPVIVKPYSGSGSRHTTLHIRDEKELRRAFDVAKQVAPVALIEEELVGPVYRATVVDGKLVAVLRRDPPHVVGDGVRTVAKLVEEANTHPGRSGPYFSKLQIDESAMEELAWQGLTSESVPEKGRRVTLHQKVNWGLGGTTADATEKTHPDNVALFEEVAGLLEAPLVGLDFIIDDIGRSWKEQKRCGVIECNSMPFFDNHHLPFEGEPRNVAGAIWDMYLRG